ncbi:MAG: glycosyltransferase [Cellulosilyticaceae bacterium]
MTQVINENNTMVSVVVVAAQPHLSIRKTIASLLEQTYQHLEIVLVDTGMEPQVSEEMQMASNQYAHMHYVQVSGEASKMAPYNRGMMKTSGQYITLLKAGDVLQAECIEKQLAYLQQHSQSVMVCADMKGLKKSEEEVYSSYYNYHKIRVYEEEQTAHLIQSNFVLGHTLCMRREVVHAVFPIPETLDYEDWWLALTGSIQGHIGYIDEALVTHYLSEETVEELLGRQNFMKHRVQVAQSNAKYYEAMVDYCRAHKHHYLAIIQPMELRDKLMSEYSVKKRMDYYFSEATYRCRRKIRFKEKMKIWAYLWCGPYLLLLRK